MKQISKSDVKELNKKLKDFYNVEEYFNKKEHITKDNQFITKDGERLFFYQNKTPIPTLKFLLKQNILKTITVDMGAIKFVTKGADIMRPGITQIEPTIKKDEYVVIIDQTHHKPLAVGIALLNAEEMLAATSGKVIKNIHFIGDEIWTGK